MPVTTQFISSECCWDRTTQNFFELVRRLSSASKLMMRSLAPQPRGFHKKGYCLATALLRELAARAVSKEPGRSTQDVAHLDLAGSPNSRSRSALGRPETKCSC